MRRSGYITGEVTSPGTLTCKDCGKETHFKATLRIQPCSPCHQTVFRKSCRAAFPCQVLDLEPWPLPAFLFAGVSMKSEETLLQTESVKVRVMELPPGEGTAWHYHQEITDHMVGLSGRVLVKLRQPDESRELSPGERCRVEAGRVHQVLNASGSEAASYLLIQGVGRYDFRPVDPQG